MAKIAVELERALSARNTSGEPGRADGRLLAAGRGWSVSDILCTSGPDDRPFEEQHAEVSVSIVVAGTFQYRSSSQRELLAPGAILLGNLGQSYECAHEHGAGDRCIAFKYDPSFFASVAGADPRFRTVRLPPLRESAALIARACVALEGASGVSWEELAVALAATAVQLANDADLADAPAPPNALARVAGAIRLIERHPEEELTLERLADVAGLSPFHFLRMFTRITGATPHQFALRARLREAAVRLATGDEKVIDVAFDCGFGDVSNFNRAFRAEFGTAPRGFRTAAQMENQP